MSEHRIPIVNELPSDLLVPLHVLPFLLTRLLEYEEALLHAEYRRNGEPLVTWYVRPRRDGQELDDRVIAQLPSGIFSSLVSRIALMADVDYQRGGAASLTPMQKGCRSIAESSAPATGNAVIGSVSIRARLPGRASDTAR
jgi:hypothetical protein